MATRIAITIDQDTELVINGNVTVRITNSDTTPVLLVDLLNGEGYTVKNYRQVTIFEPLVDPAAPSTS